MQSNVPILPAYVNRNSVTYGNPISYSEFEEKMKDEGAMQKLADELIDTIYSLGD